MCALTFGIQHTGTRVSVPIETRITIELPENAASTGYRWSGAFFDERLISLETEQLAKSESGPAGAVGQRQFVFRAKAMGETRLRLIKRRSWETAEHAVEVFEIELSIESAQPT